MRHLTFDLELYEPLRTRIEYLRMQEVTCEHVLDLLDEARLRVTLFVTGEFARTYPETFARAARVHEIASHTMTHRGSAALSAAEWEWEIAESKRVLEDAGGTPVSGFRAPMGQVGDRALGAVLHRHGYRYDSSVAATHLPGRFQGRGTPRRPYAASLSELHREVPGSPLWEIPVSVSAGVPLPCGGFFLSWLPDRAWRGVRRAGDHQVLYLHLSDLIDLRPFAEAYRWDHLKRTANSWRALEYVRRTMGGRDTALEHLLPPTGTSNAHEWDALPGARRALAG
jgi:peptidoglycan/xylan/chitin deacetylase (PgdA/CDA1 family)